MKTPKFKENRGRPAKYKFPKKKGQVLSIPFDSKEKLLSIRMAAYQFAKKHGLKFRTWTDFKLGDGFDMSYVVCVECICRKGETLKT